VERTAGDGIGRDEAAFAALVHRHAGAVFGFVLRRVRDRALAEDLTQETLLRAWRGRETYRGGDERMRGWLLAIAGNVVRDQARMRARRVAESPADAAGDLAAEGSDPAVRHEHAESIQRLRIALAALPENHREMFLLRERDGLSYKEIAEVLGCPVGSVMSGLARARERLMGAVEG